MAPNYTPLSTSLYPTRSKHQYWGQGCKGRPFSNSSNLFRHKESQHSDQRGSEEQAPISLPPISGSYPSHAVSLPPLRSMNFLQSNSASPKPNFPPYQTSSSQFMTIKTQQGYDVQIPVEMQTGSKAADQKRRRNAAASARFRARRKEKEREVWDSITRLETQLREADEDIEYYRGERDYFKSIVFQQPGAEHRYARPPSPRVRRSSVASSVAHSSNTGGSSPGFPYSA